MTWKELDEAYREAKEQPFWTESTIKTFLGLAVLFFVIAPIAAWFFSWLAA